MFSAQSSMRIARLARDDRKPFFPLGKKMPPQEIIGPGDGFHPGQAHLFHQTVLKSFKQPLDTPFRLRTVGRDPFDPQFVQRSPELRSQRISPELFGQRLRAGLLEDAVFIGVVCHRAPKAT